MAPRSNPTSGRDPKQTSNRFSRCARCVRDASQVCRVPGQTRRGPQTPSAECAQSQSSARLAQRKCLAPIKRSIGFSENVWSQSSTRLASAKMFGANQALDWLQRKCLEPIKYSIGFSENVWCQSSTRLASAKMFGLKQTSNRFRPLSAERSGGLNGYAKNGLRDGAGHAASFLVLTGGKGAKTVETSAKAGKRAERLAQPPRLGRGLSLLSSKRGVATRLRRAWRGRPRRFARR